MYLAQSGAGFYALTFNKYKDIISRPNAFYAILLGNADNTFVLPSNKVKNIFREIDPGEDKEWHYRIRQDNGHYIIRPNNDRRSIGQIHYIETYLNGWDRLCQMFCRKQIS